MQGKHHICLQLEKSVFELDLEYKVTMIIGDSGTGKTTVSRSADVNHGVLLPLTIPMFDALSIDAMLTICADNICYVDENVITYCYAPGNHVMFEKLDAIIRESTGYFILVARDPVKNITYSYEAIYVRTKDNTIFKKYPKFTKDRLKDFDVIVTEDSAGMFDVVKKWGYPTESLHGAGNISKALKQLDASKRYLFILDGDACGQYMNYLNYYNASIQFWLPPCFEYLLLKTSMFDKVWEVQDVLQYPEDYANEELSRERFYENFIYRIMSKNNAYIRYKHSDQNISCFVTDMCKHYYECGMKCEQPIDLRELAAPNKKRLYKWKYDIPTLLRNASDEELAKYFGM